MGIQLVGAKRPSHMMGGTSMKVDLYNYAVKSGLTRRRFLQGSTALAGAAAFTGAGGVLKPARSFAQSDVRAEILKIPGVGMGSPTDADWQKVGEICLGPTKERRRKASSKASS
jgi:multiple sugar transport system substrate-binding protein